jgi:SAM-dependent methyltransferase
MKLHLGCGSIRPPGWVNVDGSWNARLAKLPGLRRVLVRLGAAPASVLEAPWDAEVVYADLRNPLPFGSGSAEAVYSCRLLDCMHLQETRRLLGECFRVLQPGGVVRMVVDDITPLLRDYLERRTPPDLPDPLKRLPPMDQLIARLLFSEPDPAPAPFLYTMYRNATSLLTRKWTYDAESLIFHFSAAGFVDAREQGFGHSRIDGIADVEKNGGVCVEAVRPPVA